MLGIYSRISQLKEEGKDRSIDDQKELGEAKAKELNLKFKHYTDEGISGTGDSIDERPALTELIEDVISGKITAVFVIDESRLSRNPKTKYIIIDLFKDYSIITHSHIDGLLDYSNPDTEFISELKAVIHKRQVTETKIKLKLSLKRSAKEGKATNPVLTYGYKKDDSGYIVIDEKEANIVKRIFKMSNDGIGSEKTAKIFNEEGIKTRYAKTAKGTLTTKNKLTGKVTTKDKSSVKWSGNTILQIIKSSWYYGERPYKGEIFEVPSILDKDYCLSTIDNLQKNRINVGKTSHQWLLKGVVKCNCGCNMYGKNYYKKKEHYYHCSSKRVRNLICGLPSINQPRLDKLIWYIFFDDDKLKKLVAEHFENTNDKDMIDGLNKELAILNHKDESNTKELNTTLTYGSKGYYTEEEVQVQLKRIRTEKNDINTQILNIQNQIETYNNIIKSSDEIINEIDSYHENASFNDRKYIIKKYINSIVVDYQYNHFLIDVDFNLPNIKPQKFIVQRRFYYYKEMVSGHFFIFNKFDKIKNGKVIERTDLEFINDVFKKKQQREIAKIFIDDTIGFLNQLPKTDDNDWLLKEIKELEEIKNGYDKPF